MKGLIKIPRGNFFLLLPVFILCSCNHSTDKDRSNGGISNAGDTIIAVKKDTRILDTVIIQNMKFIPEEIKVHKGDMVVWFNHDMVAHCVTEAKHKIWTSGPISANDSWGMKVEQSSEYFCALHQVMKGKIAVIE